MAGIITNTGKTRLLNTFIKSTNLYLGLMVNGSNPIPSNSIGSGITEVTGTGYARILLDKDTDWVITDTSISSSQKTFTVGGTDWSNVGGYFIATGSTGNNLILVEAFPVNKQGIPANSDTIQIVVNYEPKNPGE